MDQSDDCAAARCQFEHAIPRAGPYLFVVVSINHGPSHAIHLVQFQNATSEHQEHICRMVQYATSGLVKLFEVGDGIGTRGIVDDLSEWL